MSRIPVKLVSQGGEVGRHWRNSNLYVPTNTDFVAGLLPMTGAEYADAISGSQPSFAYDFTASQINPVKGGGTTSVSTSANGTYVNSAGLITQNSANAARFDYDPLTLAIKGLLVEEARTNLCVRSSEFDNAAWVKVSATVTANAVASPDGTAIADKLVEAAANAQHYILQSITTTATSHTFSVYAKAAERTWIFLQWDNPACGRYFNLATGAMGSATGAGGTSTITDAGNGWYRCTLTFTGVVATPAAYVMLSTGDGVTGYLGDGASGAYIFGAQLEAGSSASSYIPTAAASVTRAADDISIALGSWFSAAAGTILAEFIFSTAPAAGRFNWVTTFSDNTLNERIQILRFEAAASPHLQVVDGGVELVNINNSLALNANTTHKAAAAYALNDFAISGNGAAVATDATGTLPTVTTLHIGKLSSGSASYVNGHIRRITYWPYRLSNAALVALSA